MKAALVAAVVVGISLISAPAQAVSVPGTVLSNANAQLPPELSPLATGKRVQYVTTNSSGGIITATGLILTPRSGRTNRTVVWSHGSTGLADQCTPSTNQDVFWPEARAAIAVLLNKGWTVAAPDYPGLGTAQAHPFLVGNSEGRAIIDSVKAARNLDAALKPEYAIDGHSQGGQGALFAGQLASSYDGNLTLKGVAAIAPASNLDLIGPAIPGTPGQGYYVMGLYGINAIDPSFDPAAYLAAPARARTGVLRTGCLYEILAQYADLTAEQLVPNGVTPQAALDKLAQYGNPGRSAPGAPILIVQGTNDESVPYEITAGPLLDQLGAYKKPVEFVPLEGETHDGAVFASTERVATWIAARFG